MTDGPAPPTGAVETWTASDLVDDVQEDDKRFGQTGSPTRVLAVRDVTPERAGLSHSDAGEARAAIEALLAERPPPDASWDKPEDIAEKPAARYDSWTLVELDHGQPTRHSLELLGRSRTLAGKLGGRNVALVARPRARRCDPRARRGVARRSSCRWTTSGSARTSRMSGRTP